MKSTSAAHEHEQHVDASMLRLESAGHAHHGLSERFESTMRNFPHMWGKALEIEGLAAQIRKSIQKLIRRRLASALPPLMTESRAIMFDLVAGSIDRPFRDKHIAASAFAVTLHVVTLGGIVASGALLFGVANELPEVPTMLAFVAQAAPPPPPAPPAPPALRVRAQRKPQPADPAPDPGRPFVVPPETPTGIPSESAMDLGGEGGVAGGVPGGMPGGVVGGVAGGTVIDTLPLPPPPPRKPARVGGEIAAPALIHRVEPVYPLLAVNAKVSGIVILEATVNEAGEVTNVVVLRSIPLLENASIAAVRQWRYEPLRLNGVPSPFVLTVTLTFSLK